jgi:bifunctional UDP-N-acetylglucosamine pyrophosphorylase / glucosamine-1-phosphate N-acetyltransferase
LPSRNVRHAVILAAGQGTRFKSDKPKVLHEICGKPMITYLLDRLGELGVDRTWVIVGERAEEVRSALVEYPLEFQLQSPQLGTGHAVMTLLPVLGEISGSVLVLYGDTPLISVSVLEQLFKTLEATGADEVLLTAELDVPDGYGRILRDEAGQVVDIIEEKEASPDQKAIREINAGFACFRAESLARSLPLLSNDNRAGEYYLTDLVKIISSRGGKVEGLCSAGENEIFGINNRAELAAAETQMRRSINRRWMLEGVTFLDPERATVDAEVEIGVDTTVLVGAVIRGRTRIGRGCVIGTYTYLEDAVLGDNARVEHCAIVRGAHVEKGRTVPPFSRLETPKAPGGDAEDGSGVERG